MKIREQIIFFFGRNFFSFDGPNQKYMPPPIYIPPPEPEPTGDIKGIFHSLIWRDLCLKALIDKTSSWVAKLGFGFEKRIHENEKNNIRFAFLLPNGPYHNYYQKKVKEIRQELGIYLNYDQLIQFL
jgi:hypothetical protein